MAIEQTEQGGAGDPAESPLGALLPGGHVRPGTAVSAGGDMPLLLALAAEVSAESAGWAAVGLPDLGALAAADAGLDVGAGLWVDEPGRQWPQVLATLLEAVPVVLTGPVPPAPARIARRLAAIMRRSGAVLLTVQPWEGADLSLQVSSPVWVGVEHGFGVLRGRRVTVTSTGRGAAARPRQADLWLPGPDGSVTAIAKPTGEPTSGVRVPAAGRAALRVVG
ncbi:hypothetical protein [Streptomyces canus]|uniref:hypothetical protein n=1 Tax=Streptomyces canus TaxID=58343 RepID=UPI001CEC1CF7|nr:hypothetical protein [Streptomyces canus]